MKKRKDGVPRTIIGVKIDVNLLKEIDAIAYAERGRAVNRSQLIEEALRLYLEMRRESQSQAQAQAQAQAVVESQS